MTREEIKKIVAVISKSYRNFGQVDSETIDAWHFMLSEYSYNDVAIALKTFITTSGSAFAPSISELIAMIHKPHELAQMSADQAWDKVYKAITRSTYYAEDEFNKLPEMAKKVIVSPTRLKEMAMDDAFNLGVESSNFKKSYNAMLTRESEINRMPTEARMRLQQIQQNLLEQK